MGLNIIIPVVLLAIIVPVAFSWAKKLKDGPTSLEDDLVSAPADRLTTSALAELPTPPWRVVYEIAESKLGGLGHVLIGPSGIYAIRTTMDPLPAAPSGDADPAAIGRAAIDRGRLDDALRSSALQSDLLVWVHWGPNEGSDIAVEVMPGVIAVDGRELSTWVSGRSAEGLAESQVDLAWQAVTTAIGRPDPLA